MTIDIIDLKETLSFDEAAKWLTDKLESDVTAADLLELAIEEKLTISIKSLTNNIACYIYKKLCHVEDAEAHMDDLALSLKELEDSSGIANVSIYGEQPMIDHTAMIGVRINDYLYAPFEKEKSFDQPYFGCGVYDFAMVGAGKADIYRIANSLRGYSEVDTWKFDERDLFLVLSDDREWAFRLTSNQEDNPLCNVLARYIHEIDYADYVIRTNELKRFYKGVTNENKPLDPRERNSYLKFIYALCEDNDIKLDQRGMAKAIAIKGDMKELKISEKKAKEIINEVIELTK